MHLREPAVLFAMIAACAWAQNGPVLEIHGVVTEAGLHVGVAGANVTAFEFAGPDRARRELTTTATDISGSFSVHPERPGDYFIEVKKPSYFSTVSMAGPLSNTAPSETAGTLVTVKAEHPVQEVRFTLMRPGEIRGTVIDEGDKPVAGLIQIWMAGTPNVGNRNVRTGKDGSFLLTNLVPGPYLVKITPGPSAITAMPQFSEDDLKRTDPVLETIYWPGAADEASASVARVNPGSPLDLGTIRLRKEESYRVRVSVAGCQPGDRLDIMLTDPSGQLMPVLSGSGLPGLGFNRSGADSCDDFMIRGLRHGSYTLVAEAITLKWGTSSFDVGRKNLEVRLALEGGMTITGHVVAAEGATLPPLEKLTISLRRVGLLTGALHPIRADSSTGAFSAMDVRRSTKSIEVGGLSDRNYVKEIRVDGRPGVAGNLALEDGSQVEIVIDDQPASITGAVRDGDRPFSQPLLFVAKWPGMEDAMQRPVTGDDDGRFLIRGLAPGEYRILAVQSTALSYGMQVNSKMLAGLWPTADRVTLDRGGTTDVAIKLSDPLQ